MTKIIIGLGNRHRRDDGIGPKMIDYLQDHHDFALTGWRLVAWEGDLLDLMDLICGCSHVVLIDGLLDNLGVPGSIYQWDLLREILPTSVSPLSSHSVGLPLVIDLLRITQKMPTYFVLIGVVVADCGFGEGLTPVVTNAMDQLMHHVLASLPSMTS